MPGATGVAILSASTPHVCVCTGTCHHQSHWQPRLNSHGAVAREAAALPRTRDMEAAASLESDSASLTSRSFVAAAIGTADSANKVSAKAKQMLRTSQQAHAHSLKRVGTC